MTALIPGFYGKLPSHGDFVRRRLSGSFVGLWDSWLQNAMARSRDQLGADWLNIYLSSPLWRFVFTPGVCGPAMSAGVLMPSVDKAGRYFPLTMVVSLPDPVNPLPLAAEYDDWFSRAESILLSALDDTEHFELDVFDRQVEECVLDFKSPPKLPAGSEATVFPGHGKSWHIGIASVDHLGASLRHLHWKQLGTHFNPLSMWWSNGSEQIAPSALLCEGIPPAESFAAMLDGNWAARQWPSIHLESVSRLTPVAVETPPAATQSPAEAIVVDVAAGTPAAAAEPAAVAPPGRIFIPEFDPMEITSPREPEGDSTAEQQAPEPIAASAQEQEQEQEHEHEHEPDTAPGPSMARTPSSGGAAIPPQAIPEMDPLHAIDTAQRSDTPLDPLEALGLTETTGDDFGVSSVPASYGPAGMDPVAAVDADSPAAELADPFDSTESLQQPGDVEDGFQAEPAMPAAEHSVARSPVFFSASATDAGKHSDFNEDALLERRDMALWAVADGSGGHWIGDVASQAVVSELETVTPSAVLGDLADDVKGKLLQAHRYLQDSLDRNSDSNAESGAAVAVFVASETMSACLSAGPVRVYRSRNGSLEQLTPESGSQARLVGHASELLLDSRFHEIEAGDWFLLCTRGLYEALDDSDITRAFSASSPEDACENLMSEALSRGAPDNVTIVVVYAASPDHA